MAQIVMVKLVVLIGSSLMGKKDEDTRLATSWFSFFCCCFWIFYSYKNIERLIFSNKHQILVQSCLNFNGIKKYHVLCFGKVVAASAAL